MIKIIAPLIFLSFSQKILCQSKFKSQTSISVDSQNEVGKDFLFPDCVSIKGLKYNSQSLKRKITLVNFWFEACEPCIAEMGKLNQIYNKYKANKNFSLVSFTFESTHDALKMANKYSLNYPIICISQDQCYKLNFYHGFPTNIITDNLGKVSYLSVGSPTDPIEVEKYFNDDIVSKINELLNCNAKQ